MRRCDKREVGRKTEENGKETMENGRWNWEREDKRGMLVNKEHSPFNKTQFTIIIRALFCLLDPALKTANCAVAF